MMHAFLIVSLSLIGTILAIPAPNYNPTTTTSWPQPTPTCKSQTPRDAYFDDLTGLVVPLEAVPYPYMGLYFQAFVLLDVVETGIAPGVPPHSGNVYAVSGSQEMTLQGSAEWTTNYPNSTIKSFNLKSYYYGCTLSAKNSASNLPVACNIAITGFAKGDNTNENVQVAAQEFEFNPSTSTGVQQMVQGIFAPEFVNLEYVLIQYTLPGGLSAAGADLVLAIDDVMYDTCAK